MSAPSAETTERRLVRLPEVIATVALSRSEVYRLIAAGEFPKQVPLGRSSAWSASEIQEWVSARIAERDKESQDRSKLGQRLVRARAAAAAKRDGSGVGEQQRADKRRRQVRARAAATA